MDSNSDTSAQLDAPPCVDASVSDTAPPLDYALPLANVDAERALAFARARQRFAMYGRQHAHVNHHVASERRRRTLATAISTTTTATTTTLKHALRLQENGALALHLDDLNYRLDGVLAHCHWSPNSSIQTAPLLSNEQLLASAQNVVALAQLLQRPSVQRALALASVSQSVSARLHRVIRLVQLPTSLLQPRNSSSSSSNSSNALQLALASLLFVMSQLRDAASFFALDVVDVIAAATRDALSLPTATSSTQSTSVSSDCDSDGTMPTTACLPGADRLQLRHSCLKRKASAAQSATLSMPSSTSSSDDMASTSAVSQQLQQRVAELLSAYDAFSIDSHTLQHFTAADVLVRVLVTLLDVESTDSSSSASNNNNSTAVTIRPQLRVAQSTTAAGAALKRVLATKQRLVDRRALLAIVQTLATQFDAVKLSLVATPSTDLLPLWRVGSMLRVLDHASFLATPVQQHLASQSTLFNVLLDMIEQLSRSVSHNQHAGHPSATMQTMQFDVLLVALRVVINLTHHNASAAAAMHARGGTRVLFDAFCRVGGRVAGLDPAHLQHCDALISGNRTSDTTTTTIISTISTAVPSEDDTSLVRFDAQLLCLSALTNCVECSAANRHALATLDVAKSDNSGATSACELLARFFLRRVQSNLTLMQPSSRDNDDDVATAQWVPEDVVIGGCASLLLGCIMADSTAAAATVLGVLPHKSPQLLLRALSAFVALHSQLGALTPDVADSVLYVERTLTSFSRDGTARPTVATRSPGLIAEPHEATASADALVIQTADVVANGESDTTVSVVSQVEVRTPPADAFKLQRWTRVCARVDSDSESGDADTRATVTLSAAARGATRSLQSTKSPSRRRVAKASVVRRSPKPLTTTPRKPTSRKVTPTRATATGTPKDVAPSTPQQLVRDLSEHLSAQPDTTSSPLPTLSSITPTVSTNGYRDMPDDDDRVDALDFSQDCVLPTASPPVHRQSRNPSPRTPLSARRRRQRLTSRALSSTAMTISQPSPSRLLLATALAAADALADASIRTASKSPARSPSVEHALKRKRRIAADASDSSSRTSSTAVFDFDT